MIPIIIDLETRSRCALDETSAYVYFRDPSTEILCMGFQVDEHDRELWLPGQPFPFADEWPDVVLLAFNAEFEWEGWHGICVPRFRWPALADGQMQCLSARSAYQGLPRKLSMLTKPLGLGTLGKDNKGNLNCKRLCKPLKAELVGRNYVGGEFDDSPKRHQENFLYCLQDIRAEGQIARLCPPLSKFEQQLWETNRIINERGVPVDTRLCRVATSLVEREKLRLAGELQTLTGIKDCTPDSLPQLKAWMADVGLPPLWPRTKNRLPGMDEATTKAALAGEYGEVAKPIADMLALRRLARDAAVAKYTSFLNYANDDGRCQGTHAFYQAGPGRFAGRGPQPQNLRRLDADTLEDRIRLADSLSRGHTCVFTEGIIPTLGGMVRLAVCAKPGHVLVVADWSAIEMRALHWLARDERTLKQIRDFDNGIGEEPYKLAAATMHNKPVSEVTKTERQLGKVMILGAGYCTGATTFAAFCGHYGIDMPLDRAKEIIQLYRRSYPLVKRFWYAIGKAAVNAVENPGTTQTVGHIDYYMTGSTLNARLPNGREIKYYDAQIIEGAYGPEVEAIDPQKGCRRPVAMPTLVENVDQGMCRDLLAVALIRCRREGLPVVLHVHDEIVIEVPEAEAESAGEKLKQIMLDCPPWANGLPLAAGMGFHKRYVK